MIPATEVNLIDSKPKDPRNPKDYMSEIVKLEGQSALLRKSLASVNGAQPSGEIDNLSSIGSELHRLCA